MSTKISLSTLLLLVIATIAASASAAVPAAGLRSTAAQAKHQEQQQQHQEGDNVVPAASLLKNEYGSHCMSAADVMALVDGIEKGDTYLELESLKEGSTDTMMVTLQQGMVEMDEKTGRVCFWNMQSEQYECAEPKEECNSQPIRTRELKPKETKPSPGEAPATQFAWCDCCIMCI